MKPTISISDDQNSVIINGQLFDFYPVKMVKKSHCRSCFLLLGLPGFDCEQMAIPCRSWERKDKKDGVFSIRQLPETEPQNKRDMSTKNYIPLNQTGTINGIKVQCLSVNLDDTIKFNNTEGGVCGYYGCAFYSSSIGRICCSLAIPCSPHCRADKASVYFKKVEE